MTNAQRRGVRSLAVASMAFLTGGAASKALGLLTVPVLARILSPAELGLLDVGAGFAATVSILVVLGSDSAVARYVASGRHAPQIWGAAAAIVVCGSAALLAVGLVAQTGLARLLTGDAARGALVTAALVHGVATAAFVAGLNVIRLTGVPRWYAVTTTLTVVAQSVGGLAVAALVRDPMAAILIWWGAVAALAAGTILVVKRPPLALPSRSDVVHLVRFGAPLVPAAIAWTVGDLGIRGVVAHAALDQLGGYSVASRVVSVMALAISGFAIAWMPFLLAPRDETRTAEIRDASLMLLAAIGAIGLAVSALAPELVLVLGGDRYRTGADAIPALAGGMLALAGLTVVAGAAAVDHRTVAVAWTSVVGAGLQVAVALILVPTLQLTGAAAASLAGYAAAAVLLATRVDLRGRMDMTTVLVIAAMLSGLILEWLLVMGGAPLPLRMGALVLMAGAASAMVGPRLRRAWRS